MEWNLHSRSTLCQSCGKGFSDQDVYHTLLYEEKTEYDRLDVCEQCWTYQYSQGANNKKGFISHWQGVFLVPASAPEAVQQETAETLLRKLLERNDPSEQAARYILAVMLERKKRVKVKAQQREGTDRVFLYEHVESGDLFRIVDPGLQLNELEHVQKQVATLLTPAPEPAANAALPPEGSTQGAEADEKTPEESETSASSVSQVRGAN